MKKLFLVLIIATFIPSGLSMKYVTNLLTSNYLVYSTQEPPHFVQVSLNFDRTHFINRPKTTDVLTTLKVKQLSTSVHLYWLMNGGREVVEHVENPGSTGNTRLIRPFNLGKGVIKDFDVHPSKDLIYLVAKNGGLFEVNVVNGVHTHLLTGTFSSMKLDPFNDAIYLVDCTRSPKLKIFDINKKSVLSFNLDACYSKWEADFREDEVYLVDNKDLFKTSVAAIKLFNGKLNEKLSKKKVHTFEENITDLVLWKEYLYLVHNLKTNIFKVSRNDNKVTPTVVQDDIFSLALNEETHKCDCPKNDRTDVKELKRFLVDIHLKGEISLPPTD